MSHRQQLVATFILTPIVVGLIVLYFAIQGGLIRPSADQVTSEILVSQASTGWSLWLSIVFGLVFILLVTLGLWAVTHHDKHEN